MLEKRDPKIGAFVLETLTTGMYTNALDTFRECVQNACDSINSAKRTGLLQGNEGAIQIRCDRGRRSLSIRDNGLGVHSGLVESRLLDIGMSHKNTRDDAGFRGIGRLAAIAYCQRLVWKTSAADESFSTVITLDCASIREHFRADRARTAELVEVFRDCIRVTREPADLTDHFFDVEMSEIDESAEVFLDTIAIEDYLCQIAPVDYDSRFLLWSPEIREWLQNNDVDLPTVNVIVSDGIKERYVYKPYSTHYVTSRRRGGNTDLRVTDLEIWPPELGEGDRFWMWYAKTPLLGTIADEKSRGLRLRMNNIGIGHEGDQIADLFAENQINHRRFNNWLLGEVHILSSDIVPNARRDGFEDNDAWRAVKHELLPMMRKLAKEIQETSRERNGPAAKTVQEAEDLIPEAKVLSQYGATSPEEADDMTMRLGAQRDKLLEVSGADAASHSLRDRASKAVSEIDQQLANIKSRPPLIGRLNTSLSRKERFLVAEICSILREELSEADYCRVMERLQAKFGSSGCADA